MIEDRVIMLPAAGVTSLVWDGDDLVDWVAGGARYSLDGKCERGKVIYAYPFDSAVRSPSGRFAFIYQKLGTKGLLIGSDHHVVREINRSFYHADVYEFPVALFRLRDGLEVIAHCPEAYNRIEIDELETGKRLTMRSSEKRAADFFHSRLSVSGDGRWLISAGWVWHPFSAISVYEMDAVLASPAILDANASVRLDSEVSTAAFVSESRIVVTSEKGAEDFRDADEIAAAPHSLTEGSIALYDLESKSLVSVAKMEEEAGELMPADVDGEFVVGFYGYPKLIHVRTGRVVHRWPQIESGKQNSSIMAGRPKLPPSIARDPAHRRFAVAQEKSIVVVTLPAGPLPAFA